jgi:hypothetical protein
VGEQLDEAGNTGEREVSRRLEQIRRRRRGGIRWHITRHTAELTIAALERAEQDGRHPHSSKRKRRTRRKRLL